MERKVFKGNIVDVINREIFPGIITVSKGRIDKIEHSGDKFENYILPGFVDAHVHIESSMVTPVEFSRMAVKHGTVAAVSDPHEIANVMGIEGVKFMIENGMQTPFKFLFGAPSCVPATTFESSGSKLDAKDIRLLLRMKGVGFLAEMMNFPGVVNKDEKIREKIAIAKEFGVPVDGHAPGIRGEDLKQYAEAGITTDHECTSKEEAIEKIGHGMKILIREGSGAKNFDKLIPLIEKFPEWIMFCTDDCHPDDFTVGHINLLIKRAVKLKFDLFDVIRAATYNPVLHYGLDVGLLKENDPADFVIVNNLTDWNILTTIINGQLVYNDSETLISSVKSDPINRFYDRKLDPKDLTVKTISDKIKVIKAIDGELITLSETDEITQEINTVCSDTEKDRLKIVVVNRYNNRPVSIGFIRGFNLKTGAIASSIAHDSHNVVCVGVDDHILTETIQWIFDQRGGIAVHDGFRVYGLPLPFGGLMSELPVEIIGEKYRTLSDKVLKLGSTLHAPFMTLSFMALLVIPHLKISDRGLFDVDNFNFTTLYVE